MPSFLAYRPGLMSHLGSILIQIVPRGPAGISIFFHFFFGPQIGLEWFPRAPGGPGGYFYIIFGLFWGPWGPPPGGDLGPPWGPIFPILGSCAVGSTSGAIYTGPFGWMGSAWLCLGNWVSAWGAGCLPGELGVCLGSARQVHRTYI